MFSYSSEVRVEGLDTLDYLDNLQSKNRRTEQGDAVVFESEVSFSIHFTEWEPLRRDTNSVEMFDYEGGPGIFERSTKDCDH